MCVVCCLQSAGDLLSLWPGVTGSPEVTGSLGVMTEHIQFILDIYIYIYKLLSPTTAPVMSMHFPCVLYTHGAAESVCGVCTGCITGIPTVLILPIDTEPFLCRYGLYVSVQCWQCAVCHYQYACTGPVLAIWLD